MIKFEKVSFDQFKKDCFKLGYESRNLEAIWENIKLPARGTSGSAGYDFVLPFDIHVMPGTDNVTIPTGIRVKMPKDVVLMCYPRSGIGFKTGVRLANTVGIIDSDYYYSDNEGHIMLKLVGGFKDLKLDAGDKVMQGVFTHYILADDDYVSTVRNGGFGSTDTVKLENQASYAKGA